MAPSAEDYKLRQMILDEWRAKRTKPQALKNIQDKLGQAAVTSSKIGYWYKRFDKGDTSIFNKNSAMHLSIQGTSDASVSKDPSNSILLTIDETNLGSFLTYDGRFIIFPNHIVQYERYIVFYDLFHGVCKKILSPFGDDTPFGMVGDFLLLWNKGKLCASKIDYGAFTFGALKSNKLGNSLNFYGDKLLLDKLNNGKFLINDCRKFVIGQLDGDEFLLFDDVKSMTLEQSQLFGKRLMGDKLQGFITNWDDYSTMKFCEFDLETMEMKQKIDAPIMMDNEDKTRHYASNYCWSNNHCYAIDEYYKSEEQIKGDYRILSFDPQSCIWKDIQITAKNASNMFVDSEDVITLQISTYDEKSTFYRFSNKKPDCLKNLAWFTILRNSKLFGGDIYRQIAHLLPYTCDLRCLIPDENAEESQPED